MNKVWNIALNDLRIFLTQPGNLVGLILIPLGITFMLGWAFSANGNSGPAWVRVDVVDLDGSEQAVQLLDALRAANDTLVLCPMDNDNDDYCRLEGAMLDLDSAIERSQNERTEALIVVPADYGQSLENFEKVELDFYAAGDPSLPNAVEQTALAVLQKINSASLTAGVADALLDDLGEQTGLGSLLSGVRDQFVDDLYMDAQSRMDGMADRVHYVTTTGEEAAPGEGFSQSIPGMGAMFVMFTVLGGMAVLSRERRQWTLQRLAALPLSRAEILGGKILTYVLLGMIQFAIVFGAGLLVNLDFGSRPLLLIPIMLAFVLCCTAIAFAVAPFINNEEQASGLARLMAFIFAPLGGAWWPLEIVPDFMKTLAYFTPVGWAMTAFSDLMWYGGGMAEILPEIGVLLGAAVVIFFFGVRGFRYDS